MVSITAQWPGHSAEEVERLITVPIEREMNGIPKENNLRSVSLYALSAVDITFDQDADRNFARQQVFNRLADLGLPSGVTPDVAPLTSPSGLIYRYTLQSPDRSPTELKTFEDWVVEPQFRSVSGVADDFGFGGGTMQYQVLLDQYRLAGDGAVAAAGRNCTRREQRQWRRRILFRGRAILLRPGSRPARVTGRHRQRRRRRARRHSDARQGRRAGNDRA